MKTSALSEADFSRAARVCLRVWLGLLALTAVTVGVSAVNLGYFHVLVALVVASLKAGLVIFWFMHLRSEGRAIRVMVFVAFVILAIFLGMTFFDVGYR